MDAARAVSPDAIGRGALVRAGTGVGTGAYVVGSLAVPAVVLATWFDVPLADAVAVAAVLGAAAGFTAAVAPRRVEPVRRADVALRLLVVPVVAAIAAVVAATVSSGSLLGPGVVATLASALGLLVLRSGAATHHARRVGADNEALAALPEVDGHLPVRRQRLLFGAFGLAWLAFAAGSLAETGTATLLGVPTWAVEGTIGVGFLAVALASDRSLSVTEAGVLVETSLSARLYAWDEFAGYHRGDRLVLLRRESWRSDVAFDRDAVSADAFAVVDESLPEREHRAVPAGDAERRSDRAAGER